jgi:hypothetical protein
MRPTATERQNPSDRESKGLKPTTERGSRLLRRPENHKLLCQPLRCHLLGLINKINRLPQHHNDHQTIIDVAVYLLCTLDLIDRGGL